MKKLLFLLLVGISAATTSLSAQNASNFWSDAANSEIPAAVRAGQTLKLDHQRNLRLDLAALKSALRAAPMEATAAAKNAPLLLTMPMADGTNEVFEIYESPVMEPALAARYPMIKTFAGRGRTDRYATIHLDYGTEGFHAIVRNPVRGEAYISPTSDGQETFYTAYFSRDNRLEGDQKIQGICGNDEWEDAQYIAKKMTANTAERSPETILNLRTYRMALSCTGEFASLHQGTKAGVMSAFNTIINICNAIWQEEVAIKMLIVNNDNLIFLSGATDPYSSANMGKILVNQNINVYPSIINTADYDTGFLLTGCCTDVGGVGPFATFCNAPNKMVGVACQCQSITSNFYINTLVHEIGHKLTSFHTMNNCAQYGDQVTPQGAYEPGSGSTIMSYAGACDGDNVQAEADNYYHVKNLEQILDFTRANGGSICPGIVTVNNNIPIPTIPLQNGFYIPISTPFQLAGSATDADNDNLTYCWEQFDLGTSQSITQPGSLDGQSPPLFRSFLPTPTPTRVFPRLSSILNNSSIPGELLPTNNRGMTFRMTVRDNNPTAGAAVWAEVKFNATTSAGPFRVLYPNAVEDTLTAGKYVEVKWNVANTDNALVKCKKVNILLSVNGGTLYPTTLISNTENDGSQFVLIPETITTTNARIRIEAADNIFFDLSDKNFVIRAAEAPNYSAGVFPDFQRACLPVNLTFDVKTSPILGYSDTVALAVISGLPAGATATFGNNNFAAGGNSLLTLNLPNGTPEGIYSLVIRTTAPNADTLDRVVKVRVVSNNFATLSTNTPLDGAAGLAVLPTFAWTGAADAESYIFQLSTTPSFATSVIDTVITGTLYTSSVILSESTIYYWRMKATNECKSSDFTGVKSFATLSLSCASYSSNTIANITASGTPTVESTIIIPTSAILSDVNVTKLQGFHDFFKDLEVRLISPSDTSVLLFKSVCGSSNGNFLVGLDDQSPNPVATQCPLTNGKIVKPQENLSKFNNQNTQGTWKLRIKDQTATSGGQLTSWEIRVCAGVSLNAPAVVKNDTLPVAPGKHRFVNNTYLNITDNNNTADQLTLTLVRLPRHGNLFLNGNATAMQIGSQFRQSDVNNNGIKYKHDGSLTEQFDDFTFTVTDGAGGYVGTPQFNFKLDPTAPNAATDLADANDMLLYPNPADNILNIELLNNSASEVQLIVFNTQGQTVATQKYANTNRLQVATNSWANGVYVVKVLTREKTAVRKVTIQH